MRRSIGALAIMQKARPPYIGWPSFQNPSCSPALAVADHDHIRSTGGHFYEHCHHAAVRYLIAKKNNLLRLGSKHLSEDLTCRSGDPRHIRWQRGDQLYAEKARAEFRILNAKRLHAQAHDRHRVINPELFKTTNDASNLWHLKQSASLDGSEEVYSVLPQLFLNHNQISSDAHFVIPGVQLSNLENTLALDLSACRPTFPGRETS
jgi:hypothetical protein